eukprot:TRINITY_DN87410_c0_g1_i1.p3 TRINITY_DN87410_c0_g1~~TRINITY_DN87410_c0_g1_i1.p3  ORF type:complete len:107 (-),score=29.73 TRINITY_DN87410_c0_g1_i1:175-495(-)
MLREVASHAQSRLGELSCQELSNFAWAYAKLCLEQQYLFSKIVLEASLRWETFTLEDLAKMSWAFAVMPNLDPCSEGGKRLPQLMRRASDRLIVLVNMLGDDVSRW